MASLRHNADDDEDLGELTSARYGKDLVRVCRVVRHPATKDGQPGKQEVVEYVVQALLEGDFAESFTAADNARVVPTDTVKNTVYIFAKTSPHVLTPELFALHLGLHFTSRYDHISKAHVKVTSLKWSRIDVDGIGAHPHSFLRDGEEKRVVAVVVSKDAAGGPPTATLSSGLKDLVVMKTAGSAFNGFWRDENTTLPEVDDRIFSTSVTCEYTIPLPLNIPLGVDRLGEIDQAVGFEKTYQAARKVTLETFATHDSASVQATLYLAAQSILRAAPPVKDVSYSLPNVHYMPINLGAFGLENGKGRAGGVEVFEPVSSPSGLIQATVTRKAA